MAPQAGSRPGSSDACRDGVECPYNGATPWVQWRRTGPAVVGFGAELGWPKRPL